MADLWGSTWDDDPAAQAGGEEACRMRDAYDALVAECQRVVAAMIEAGLYESRRGMFVMLVDQEGMAKALKRAGVDAADHGWTVTGRPGTSSALFVDADGWTIVHRHYGAVQRFRLPRA
ncbi:MAG: hypothetical protein E6Q97_24905 [Desulfurellales bacterium]|nr:MAG: hypothetical protein E6Q97_24905 [Desulfurellales bacterium]